MCVLLTNQPRCARLAAWGTAVLRGRVAIDHALDAVLGEDEAVEFVALPGTDGPVSFTSAIGEFRRLAITGLVYAAALPGDVMGLPGPPIFNAAAVASGGAVLAADGLPLGFLATVQQHGPEGDAVSTVEWQSHEVARFAPAPTLSLSEAERQLLETLNESVTELGRLDVERWREEATDLAVGWHEGAQDVLPPGLPERAQRLIGRSERMAQVLALAIDDDGGAVSSSEAVQRRQTLTTLQRHVQQAAVTAWNSGLSPAASVP